MEFNMGFRSLIIASLLGLVGSVSVNETETSILLANDEISFGLLKTTSAIQNLTYLNVSLLGPVDGLTGQAYTDFPSDTFTTTGNSSYEIFTGNDWAGVVFTDNDTFGSTVQRSWFLHASEPGIHSFVRLAYYNDTVTSKGELGESRTMFRPNGGPWSYIITNGEQWAPLPSAEAVADEVVAQDATWYLGLTPDDPYVIAESDYFTKYTFMDNQTNKAHGLFGFAPDNATTLGAWWVVNQKDTFFGGPASLHADLMVDGIIYNKQSTNHGGATNPNITNGFDRTFGPQFLYFNHGNQSTTFMQNNTLTLVGMAEFYDDIAPYVRGYAPSSVRGTFHAEVSVPEGALEPLAILSANGVEFQASNSAANYSAYQYWTPVQNDGSVDIACVKEGIYRLTVIAKGIFGDYIQDNIIVSAGESTSENVTWIAESGGTELWRIGVPDKTSGEFRNGFERDKTHTNQPAKYRIYWGAWDYPTQFPNGVNFTIGTSDESVDWNYVHWSRFGPTFTRNETVTNVNEWQINFKLETAPSNNSIATYTMQLAGVETTAGNTDVASGSNPTVPILTYINNQSEPLNWTIQAYQSSSCGERSAISCHLLHNKWEFPGSWLVEGWNAFVLVLPFDAPVYAQYDALRLELNDTTL
ncbi:rhamnogalacturonan lyase [Gymnopus androsaceus JB14]|uniref:rhamnogalacturonan endolyase n=1 Tax=Gymnopus androsaceus JB14 TaxID=1447944 RepID=A0A6A4IFG1_9AGAR|nr:rhamnogalacturonan lyase [Gymnopus androsaceus JB14]